MILKICVAPDMELSRLSGKSRRRPVRPLGPPVLHSFRLPRFELTIQQCIPLFSFPIRPVAATRASDG